MLKLTEQMSIAGALGAHPALAAAAARAGEREVTIARIALLVGDHGEARRAVELAERVGREEAARSPVALASERVSDYIRAVYDIAARGDPLPSSEAELRSVPEAQRWRAVDAAKALWWP